MQCLRLSAFERRSRLDVQSDASLPCPQPLLAGVRSGGSEGSSGGEAEIADVEGRSSRRRSGGRAPLAELYRRGRRPGEPLELRCVDEGEGRSSRRRNRRRAPRAELCRLERRPEQSLPK